MQKVSNLMEHAACWWIMFHFQELGSPSKFSLKSALLLLQLRWWYSKAFQNFKSVWSQAQLRSLSSQKVVNQPQVLAAQAYRVSKSDDSANNWMAFAVSVMSYFSRTYYQVYCSHTLLFQGALSSSITFSTSDVTVGRLFEGTMRDFRFFVTPLGSETFTRYTLPCASSCESCSGPASN